MRCFNSARNSSSRACLTSSIVRWRTIDSRSTRSARDADSLDDIPREVGGAGGRHYVGATDQGLRPGQQFLGDLDAVLRRAFGRERGELLADVPRDVYPGNLVVEDLRLSGAAKWHEAEQDADSIV